LLVVYTMSKADDLQTRTEAFADLSIQFVQGLPNTPVAQRMGNQYLDAATSVAANYRAARRGRSYAEFTAKLGIVLLVEAPQERKYRQHRCDGSTLVRSRGAYADLLRIGTDSATPQTRSRLSV
jgi:hypothetical protein